MIRNLLAACCGPLLLAGCAHGIATRPADGLGSSEFVQPIVTPPAVAPVTSGFVETVRDYELPRDVPASYRHLVDWHTGLDPIVLLLTAGGRRACAITPSEATRVVVRQPYRCRWSAAR